ncbi:MAG: hypothetical protein ACT4QE_13775 [Anaerolineales bacterium]
MNRRSALAALFSTVALVVWGTVFWGWAYEFFGIFNKLPADVEVVAVLEANGTTTGTYFFPWPRNTPESMAAFVAQHKTGPFFQLSYIKEGVDPQSPGKILLGVLQYLVVSMLGIGLLRLSAAHSASFARKFLVIFLAGLIGSVFIRLGDPIWFHLPWPHTLGNAVYEIVAWAVMGAVIGLTVKE